MTDIVFFLQALLETLTGALERCAAHSCAIDGDVELCRRLCRATAAAATAAAERPSLLEGVVKSMGKGASFRFLPDPPLVALEVEASQAALAVLLHLHTAGAGDSSARTGLEL